jgi:hypothetical protein
MPPLGPLVPIGTGGPRLTGYGKLAVTNSSVLVNTLTGGAGSSGFPTTQTTVTFYSDPASTGSLYLCPFGGTSSATAGIPLSAGASWQITLDNPSLASVFSTAGATLWCWW